MAKRKRNSGATTIERRIKEGRGQGKLKRYKPWLTIQDVPSQGLASRIKGWKTGRVHHLMSELESNYLYVLDWAESVVDIREQFPLLPLAETQAIAEQCQIIHPTDPKTKEPIVMTTDFLIIAQSKGQPIKHARAIKCASDLQSQRTLEKLEIERLYWHKQNVDWGIVTEREIPKTVVDNIKWLRSYRSADSLSMTQEDIERSATAMLPRICQATDSLVTITNSNDDRLGLEPGQSLSIVRYLLANKHWKVDINQPIQTSERLMLVSSTAVDVVPSAGVSA